MIVSKLVPVLFSVILLYSCHENTKETNVLERVAPNDTISFKVDFFNPSNANAVNLSYIDEKGDFVSIEADPDDIDTHSFKIVAQTPLFLLDWTENQTYYILKPEEKITITFADNNEQKLHFKSSLPNREKELSFFENLGDFELDQLKKTTGKQLTKADLFKKKKKNKRLKDMRKAISLAKEKYERRLTFTTRYEQENVISESFKKIIRLYFIYDLWTDILANLRHAPYGAKLNLETIELQTGLNRKDLNCDNCLYIPSYKSAMQDYVELLTSSNKLGTLNEQFEFLKNSFSGKTREYVLFLLLKKEIRNSASVKDTTLFTEFKQLNSNPLYDEYLTANITFLNELPKSDAATQTLLLDKLGETISFEDVLKRHKNKLIFIDFWASWCKPCIEEIPSSKKISSKFVNKDIIFIYLSLDKDRYKWIESEQALGLTTNSYLVVNNFESKLAKNFNIKGIPRYILLSRKGAVINSDAPRPSNPDLEVLIEKSF